MSSGFHRMGANAGKVPGWSNKGIAGGIMRLPPMPVIEIEKPGPATDATLLDSERMGRSQAIQSGYTGDQCDNCNSMRMKISGHCMVCEDCGTTTGCS